MAATLGGCELVVNGALHAMLDDPSSRQAPQYRVYCITADEMNVYPDDTGSCRAGGHEISATQYRDFRVQQDNAPATSTRAATPIASTGPVYCLTALSGTAYTARSGTCASGERKLSKSEYDAIKAKASDLTAQP